MPHGHHHHSHKLFDPASAHKLEDPERLTFMPADEVVEHLNVKHGTDVADIGAGTGYFALPLAKAIAPGKVYAVDVQPEMLKLLDQKLGAPGAPDNIHLVEGDAAATTLPDKSVDLALLANMWHEIDDHGPVLLEMSRILRSGGTLAVLDWRPDVDRPPGPPLEYRISPANVARTLEQDGWRVVKNQAVGTYSYLVIGVRER
jgi:ubiquinone/menaquinone biosynthesis C-methylase UbiE